ALISPVSGGKTYFTPRVAMVNLSIRSAEYPKWTLLFTSTLPRAGFWFLMGIPAWALLVMRRKEELERLALATVATEMTDAIFVKDRSRRFIYAEERLIHELRKIPENKDLTAQSIVGMRDEEIFHVKAHPEFKDRVDYYINWDNQLLGGQISRYQD